MINLWSESIICRVGSFFSINLFIHDKFLNIDIIDKYCYYKSK